MSLVCPPGPEAPAGAPSPRNDAAQDHARSPAAMATTRQIVLLGASNLTRGLGIAIPLAIAHSATAESLTRLDRQSEGGPARDQTEGRPHSSPPSLPKVLVAVGNGRSYGAWSSFMFMRSLPGIAHCGLWRDIAGTGGAGIGDRIGSLGIGPASSGGETRTYAVLTDVGNDIAYGRSPETILQWVEACVDRLLSIDACVVLTGIPLANLEALSAGRFALVRRLYFPFVDLDFAGTLARARELDAGLRELVAARANGPRAQLRLVDLNPAYYSFDAIHIHTRSQRQAWGRVFAAWWSPSPTTTDGGVPVRGGSATADGWPTHWERRDRRRVSATPGLWWRLWTQCPDERRLCGRRQHCPQPALRLADGTPVALY